MDKVARMCEWPHQSDCENENSIDFEMKSIKCSSNFMVSINKKNTHTHTLRLKPNINSQ